MEAKGNGARRRIEVPGLIPEWELELTEDCRRELGELPEHVAERREKIAARNSRLMVHASRMSMAILLAALAALALATAGLISLLRDVGWIAR